MLTRGSELGRDEVVTVVIGEQGATYLQAALDTDYGALAGAISEAREDEHEGVLCFQLVVERLCGRCPRRAEGDERGRCAEVPGCVGSNGRRGARLGVPDGAP
jgi:hypothetical protein